MSFTSRIFGGAMPLSQMFGGRLGEVMAATGERQREPEATAPLASTKPSNVYALREAARASWGDAPERPVDTERSRSSMTLPDAAAIYAQRRADRPPMPEKLLTD